MPRVPALVFASHLLLLFHHGTSCSSQLCYSFFIPLTLDYYLFHTPPPHPLLANGVRASLNTCPFSATVLSSSLAHVPWVSAHPAGKPADPATILDCFLEPGPHVEFRTLLCTVSTFCSNSPLVFANQRVFECL